LKGRSGDIRPLDEAHRSAVRTAVEQVSTILRQAGETVSRATLDAVQRTLEALPSEGVTDGRLTGALEPAGFEILRKLSGNAPARKANRKSRKSAS
jgi:hypothetical protein